MEGFLEWTEAMQCNLLARDQVAVMPNEQDVECLAVRITYSLIEDLRLGVNALKLECPP